MAAVVALSNVLVQYPVHGTIGAVSLADILTYGAFTYPLAFLVTDLTNRHFGPARARQLALVGFAIAVALSVLLASPRIALASGTAFLLAQLLDVSLFNRLRDGAWWRAPLVSSVIASSLDTAVFFSLAFSAAIPFAVDGFATEVTPLFGLGGAAEAPRWVSWAIADFAVKTLVAFAALAPYRLMAGAPRPA
ncbi:MAG: VUT family protein [Pseudomonadota bacterium]